MSSARLARSAEGALRTDTLAALGAMTATVAHEVRNLLGGIELYASLLAEQCASDEALAPMTGRLLDGVQRLHAVAANLLAVGRRPVLERGPVDLARVATEALDSAALALRGSGIELRRRCTASKAWIDGDGQRLGQALLNVILNAVQAMPDGGALTVTIHTLADRVSITVRDTGVGMDRATLRRAGERFFTTRPHGTGLGLAVVRDITEGHGGRLALQSRPGHGTRVRLTFPLLGEAGA